GVSGRDMMAALIAGQRDPTVLAQLARARMRAKISDLREAFHGRFTDHHAFLLAKMLARIDALDADIAEVESPIEQATRPFPEADFVDLGVDFYDARGGTQRAIRNHVHRLDALGYTVTLQPAA